MPKVRVNPDGVLEISPEISEISALDFAPISTGSVKKVVIPLNINKIDIGAFYNFQNLEEVFISDGVTEIGQEAFKNCPKLKSVRLPVGLKKIPAHLFDGDVSLEKVDMGRGVEKIDSSAFSGCKSLKSFICPEGLRIIKDRAFYECENLTEIKLNDKLEQIEFRAFYETNIKDLSFPESLKKIDNQSHKFDSITSNYLTDISNAVAQNYVIHYKSGDLAFNDDEFAVVNGVDNTGAVWIDRQRGDLIVADAEGVVRVIERDQRLRLENNKWNELDRLEIGYFPLILDWLKCRNIPHRSVVQAIPRAEIPYFHANNNPKNWAEISRIANMKTMEGKQDLANLAHALGAFSKDGKQSKTATDFIKMYILDNYNEEQFHAKFSGFDSVETPFNPEFAKFFMEYFPKNPDFMTVTDSEGETFDLLKNCYNNFAKIQELYPNKKVITRHDNERLTPEMVANALREYKYDSVTNETEFLANTISKFGYSQSDFDKLSDWFIQGKAIRPEDMVLKVQGDDENQPVTYELLDKSDPLGAVLGDITNCCQTVNNTAESCVRYGMTQPNSGFIVFKHGSDILGQAWVWYDEKAKQVTLDNIEVPRKVLEKISTNPKIEHEILDCLDRLGSGFDKAMNNKSHTLDRVTIGKGYNDFNKILSSKLSTIKRPVKLSNYQGYTDAEEQYLLENFSNEFTKTPKQNAPEQIM